MKNIKQIAYTGVAGMLAFAPLMAGAADTVGTVSDGSASISNAHGKAGEVGVDSGLTSTSFYEIISKVMNWLLGLVGILAVIGFVISGILYLTSAGDEDRIEKAKSFMLYAIIGLVVAFIGLVVVNLLAGLLDTGGGGAVGNF